MRVVSSPSSSATEVKKVVKINADLMAADLRTRFLCLFQVARTHSIVQWKLVRPNDADVVVSDTLPEQAAQAVTLLVGHPVTVVDTERTVQLEASFRVMSVMRALDLAAARVLKMRDAAQQDAAVPDDPLGYRLKHWVTLEPGRMSRNHARVLAAMSRRHVTRRWMADSGGLTHPQIDELLADLQGRNVLQAADPFAPTEAVSPRPATHSGFIGRLRHWIAQGQSLAPTSSVS